MWIQHCPHCPLPIRNENEQNIGDTAINIDKNANLVDFLLFHYSILNRKKEDRWKMGEQEEDLLPPLSLYLLFFFLQWNVSFPFFLSVYVHQIASLDEESTALDTWFGFANKNCIKLIKMTKVSMCWSRSVHFSRDMFSMWTDKSFLWMWSKNGWLLILFCSTSSK